MIESKPSTKSWGTGRFEIASPHLTWRMMIWTRTMPASTPSESAGHLLSLSMETAAPPHRDPHHHFHTVEIRPQKTLWMVYMPKSTNNEPLRLLQQTSKRTDLLFKFRPGHSWMLDFDWLTDVWRYINSNTAHPWSSCRSFECFIGPYCFIRIFQMMSD